MIEEKIKRVLSDNALVKEQVAIYNDVPAVFYQQAANDMDPGWGDGPMYPRIDFDIEWSYRPERVKTGNLYVNVWALNESEIQPEDIAFPLKDYLSNVFISDDDADYCAFWNRIDGFDGTSNEPKTVGTTITFTLMAFPAQQHGDPDPVKCIQQAVKEICPEIQLIEYDDLQDTYIATNENPVVYVWERSSRASDFQLFGSTFLECDIKVHVICPEPRIRAGAIQRIAALLTHKHRLIMDDDSPFLLDFGGVQAENESDPMAVGQITISGRNGVAIRQPEVDKIQDIVIE